MLKKTSAGVLDSRVSANEEPTSLELCEERIRPILLSEDPSSCVQCHLSLVDLKDYILPSHQQTFASLNAQKLIDLKNPDKSKILKLFRWVKKTLKLSAGVKDPFIGCHPNPTNYFQGIIDDVAAFDDVLSREDIEKIVNRGLENWLPVEASGKNATHWARIKNFTKTKWLIVVSSRSPSNVK